MNIQNCVTVIGASKPAFYHAAVGGAEFDLYIFKAVGAHKLGEPQNIFSAKLDTAGPEPEDFFFAELMVNGEAVKRFKLSPGYSGEAFDGAYVEAEYHGKVQHIAIPDELMHRLDSDHNLDIEAEGFQR